MTQPYGTPPGGYPQQPPPGYGYPAPAYGYPPVYAYGPQRPGTATGAAVLGFIQAGLSLLGSVGLTFVLIALVRVVDRNGAYVTTSGFDDSSVVASRSAWVDTVNTVMTVGWVTLAVQVIAAILLIVGGAQLIGGRSRVALITGASLEILLGLSYLGLFFVPTDYYGSGAEVSFFFLAIFGAFLSLPMPVISLALASTPSAGQYVASRRSGAPAY